MKYYSEGTTRQLRISFEEKVLCWPEVSTKKMFGCPCYLVNSKLFAFLLTSGIVITHLPQADREALAGRRQTIPFQAGKRCVQKWLRLTLQDPRELDEVLPFVRKSYESVRNS